MKKYITTLSIAGSDCSGGAGIQADIKTMSALGCYAATVITAVTAQNTVGVQGVLPVPPDMVEAQIRSVMDDLHPNAIKIGMVNDEDTISAIASTLKDYPLEHVVIDPVMISSSGQRLMKRHALDAFITQLLPLATLITPNISEAEILFPEGIEAFQAQHPQAVLLKGGHREGSEKTDLLYLAKTERMEKTAKESTLALSASSIAFSASSIDTQNTHGTGCTLSSAITAFLAQGFSLQEAVSHAKDYLTNALKEGSDVEIGRGHGPVNHLYHPLSLIRI